MTLTDDRPGLVQAATTGDQGLGGFALRLLPRLVGDVLAVAIGLAVFDVVVVRRFNADQALLGLVYVAVAAVIDVTHVRREWSRVEELVLAMKVALGALIVTTAVVFLVAMHASRIVFLSVTVSMVVIRPVLAYALHSLESENRSPRTLVALCSDVEFEELAEAIADREVAPLRIVARVGAHAPDHLNALRRTEVSGLIEACATFQPWRVVVGSHDLDREELARALVSANEAGAGIRSLNRLFEEEFGRVPLVGLDASWFLFDISPLHNLGYRMCRRVVDVVAGLFIGSFCLAVLPFVWLATKLASNGSLLYRQKRIGRHGELLELVKFRTMTDDAERSGPRFAEQHDPRITGVGRILRKSRLDELPQFLNLLRGEMSLIGPRPERPEFLDQLGAEISFFEKRHLVKPGLTGWAQVHEGYGSTIEDMRRKLERDLYYLKYQSLGLDLRIVAATVSNVLRFQGR